MVAVTAALLAVDAVYAVVNCHCCIVDAVVTVIAAVVVSVSI